MSTNLTTPIPETASATVEELMEQFRGIPASVHRERLMSALAQVFAQLPYLQCITGAGHTPYFNDGDPCVHSEEFAVNHVSEYGEFIITEDFRYLRPWGIGGAEAYADLLEQSKQKLTPALEAVLQLVYRLPWEDALGTDWLVYVDRHEGSVRLRTESWNPER